jgi:two-component system, NtrC family, response regulator PilR
VPPLRERMFDLPALCAHVLQRIARDAGVTPVPTLEAQALQRLSRHGFPGNVRELENLLHRALALAGTQVIARADLSLPDDTVEDVERPLEPVPASRAPALPAPGAALPALPGDLEAYLDGIEREILERALERHRYNRTAAGASLGLSLRQMRYRMARLGVGVADGDAG